MTGAQKKRFKLALAREIATALQLDVIDSHLYMDLPDGSSIRRIGHTPDETNVSVFVQNRAGDSVMFSVSVKEVQ